MTPSRTPLPLVGIDLLSRKFIIILERSGVVENMALPKSGRPRHKKYRQEFRNFERLITGNAGSLINPNPAKFQRPAEHLIAAHVGRRGKIRLVRREKRRVG